MHGIGHLSVYPLVLRVTCCETGCPVRAKVANPGLGCVDLARSRFKLRVPTAIWLPGGAECRICRRCAARRASRSLMPGCRRCRFGELAPDRLVWPYALGRDTSVVRKRASMVAMSSCGTGVSAGTPGWSPPPLALNAMLRTVW